MILKKHCPHCNQAVEVIREFDLPGGRIHVVQFFCGHYESKKKLTATDLNLVSEDGKKPFVFQTRSAEFVVRSGARAGVFHAMGLGKTIVAIMVVHGLNMRFLCIVKSGLKVQWQHEIPRWAGDEWMPQIIESEDEFILSKVKGYVVSYDLLRRFNDLEAWVKKLGVEILILDEIQYIKNHDSKRTNCVRKIAEGIPHLIALSGTPIKNNAREYFPVLNLLRPDKFYSLAAFDRDWVQTYYDRYGRPKTGGLKDEPRFKEYTKDFIIRYTREEVLPDLPTVNRVPLFTELGSEVRKAYDDTYNQFLNAYNNPDQSLSQIQQRANLMAYLSRMRHLTGLAKLQPAVEYVKDFLTDTDRKIVLFVHHKDVGVALKAQIEALDATASNGDRANVLQLSADLDSKQRYDMVEQFKCDGNRVLIASTLASGEGLNLQFCADCIMLERQWNPANEEQAECRFIRIGQTSDKVNAVYIVATGTIDEYLAELVEKKRAMMDNALDGKTYNWNETELMQELMDVLAAKGNKKWAW